MQTIAASSRQQAPVRATAAPRPRPPALRATARPSIRTRSVVSDVGKYLSEAASQIFSSTTTSVPWEASSQPFAGAIVHHEEAARLTTLKAVVDTAVKEIESSMDEAPDEDPAAAAPGEDPAAEFVQTSIQRVFSGNFGGGETEPKAWVSSGYASRGRARSQRELRQEYQRLQRFQSLVNRVVEEAKVKSPQEANKTDL